MRARVLPAGPERAARGRDRRSRRGRGELRGVRGGDSRGRARRAGRRSSRPRRSAPGPSPPWRARRRPRPRRRPSRAATPSPSRTAARRAAQRGPRRRLASMRAVSNVLLWPVRTIGAYLPDGWGGLARQLAIFIPFDIAYELSRAVATGGRETALQHARDVVDAEQSLGIYQELAVQRWALDAPDFVMEVAKFTYFQCQFTITFGFVLWVYVLRQLRLHAAAQRASSRRSCSRCPATSSTRRRRRGCCPTRASSTRCRRRRSTSSGILVTLFGNPYAAMPSLHTATAILVGSTGVLVTRHLLVRLMWAFYPGARRLLDRRHGQPLLPRRDRRRGHPGRRADDRDHAASPQGLVARAPQPTAHRREPTARRRRAPGPGPACHLPLDEHVAHAPGPDQVRLHRRRPPARHARRARPQREPRHAQPADRARLQPQPRRRRADLPARTTSRRPPSS